MVEGGTVIALCIHLVAVVEELSPKQPFTLPRPHLTLGRIQRDAGRNVTSRLVSFSAHEKLGIDLPHNAIMAIVGAYTDLHLASVAVAGRLPVSDRSNNLS